MTRVIMVVNSDYRHDSRVQKEALALLQAGYSVTVLSLTRPGPREQDFAGVRVLNPTTGRMSWFPGRAVNLRAYRQILQGLLREGGEIWHAHDLEMLPFAYFASKVRGGKLVYDSHELWHGYDWPGRGGRWRAARRLLWKSWLALERALAKRCHLVITVSESCARSMAGALGIKTPLVVRNCVDPVILKDSGGAGLRQTLRLGSGEMLVVYSGLFKTGRGLEQLLKAWSEAPVSGHLALVGSGPLEGRLRRFSQENELENIHFLPPVPAWELPEFISEASLGVVLTEETDLSSRYSLPNKLFEYLAAGVPVLASGLPEIRRLVEGYEAGCLTDPADPASPGAVLRDLVNSREKLKKLKMNVLKAREKLTWQEEAGRLINGYSEIRTGNQ